MKFVNGNILYIYVRFKTRIKKMANVSAQLNTLLSLKADLAFYTQQQIFWSGRYDNMAAKAADQVSYEEKWYEAYDKIASPDDPKKNNGIEKYKGQEFKLCNKGDAERYANLKVARFDQDKLEEYTDLEIEYETMKTFYESQMELTKNQISAVQQNLGTAAQDTGLLQSGS